MSDEKWCEWHVIVVEGALDDDTREVTVMHPDCGFTFTTGEGFEHHCAIQWEINNCGFDTLLDGHGPGWYRARMRHVTVRGFDWSEIDAEYEVESLAVVASVPSPPAKAAR